jgi:hypothetical protein
MAFSFLCMNDGGFRFPYILPSLFLFFKEKENFLSGKG